MDADETNLQHARIILRMSSDDMAFKKSMGAAARTWWCQCLIVGVTGAFENASWWECRTSRWAIMSADPGLQARRRSSLNSVTR